VAEFITYQQFVARFPRLVLDQRTFPKQREAMVTLLVGAMIDIEIGRPYTESGINTQLQTWVDSFGGSIGLDRVTVRRMLVDEGYLHRDPSGGNYVLRARSPYFGYEWSIRSLDLGELVEELGQRRADRKEAHSGNSERED
jgi:hypothetical protein